MTFADDHAVTSTGPVFHYNQDAVGKRFSEIHDHVRRGVAALPDDDALSLDPQAWAAEIAAELAVTAPRPDVDKHDFRQQGRIRVNGSGWPGIS